MKPIPKNTRFLSRAEWFCHYNLDNLIQKTKIAVICDGIIYEGIDGELFHSQIIRRENLYGDIEEGYVIYD